MAHCDQNIKKIVKLTYTHEEISGIEGSQSISHRLKNYLYLSLKLPWSHAFYPLLVMQVLK